MTREALILLYSHLLRLDIQYAALQKRTLISCELLESYRTDYLGHIAIERPQCFDFPELVFPPTFLQVYLAQVLAPTAARSS